MNILVDSGLKKKIQIENRKNRRGIYYLWLFEKISFALVIAYAILFPIYCIVTGKFVSTNMRTGELSYFLVASFTSCIVAMGLAAVLFIYVLRIRLEHTFIGGRIDEMIEIVDDKLFYIFRIKRVFKFVWISFTAPSAISDKIGLSFVETVMTLDCVIIMPNGVVE